MHFFCFRWFVWEIYICIGQICCSWKCWEADYRCSLSQKYAVSAFCWPLFLLIFIKDCLRQLESLTSCFCIASLQGHVPTFPLPLDVKYHCHWANIYSMSLRSKVVVWETEYVVLPLFLCYFTCQNCRTLYWT